MERVWQGISAVMDAWHDGKVSIENSVAISHDALHVFFGVLVLVAAGLILRRPISSWRPWLWVLALTLWNETVDLWNEQWPDRWMQYGEGVKDVALTMAVPTVLMLAARLRPELFRNGTGRRRNRG